MLLTRNSSRIGGSGWGSWRSQASDAVHHTSPCSLHWTWIDWIGSSCWCRRVCIDSHLSSVSCIANHANQDYQSQGDTYDSWWVHFDELFACCFALTNDSLRLICACILSARIHRLTHLLRGFIRLISLFILSRVDLWRQQVTFGTFIVDALDGYSILFTWNKQYRSRCL